MVVLENIDGSSTNSYYMVHTYADATQKKRRCKIRLHRATDVPCKCKFCETRNSLKRISLNSKNEEDI